jgi:hypothetical protein
MIGWCWSTNTKIKPNWFTCTSFQQDFHMKWCSCRLAVTRWVLHVEQEVLILVILKPRSQGAITAKNSL